jgi:predicted nucleic acid-binding protein
LTSVVLDASVVLKWFAPRKERGSKQARATRTSYEEGQLRVVVPSLLILELLNVAGRRWGWDEPRLRALVTSVEGLGFEFALPEGTHIASWVARGLTAYDAVYVALAERRRLQLITDDASIIAVARDIAAPLIPL